MKKIVALLLCVLVIISLSACTMGTDASKLNQDASATEATEAPEVDIEKYSKDFDSMQKYFVELKLITDNDKSKSKTDASVIGAKQGVRYKLDNTNFVEFYEIDTTATPDEAVKLVGDIENNGVYKVLGFEDVKGVVSGSGKYVMLYPASSTYNYDELAEEFVKF